MKLPTNPKRGAVAWPLVACLALAACERGEAPSDQLRASVESTIDDAVETAKMAEASNANPGGEAAALLTRYTGMTEDGKPLVTGKWAPKNECSDVEGVEAFRMKLAQTVIAQDLEGLVALTSPDVRLDFGGGSGHAELTKRLTDPSTELWGELSKILPLGCAQSNGNIVMPWYQAQDLGSRDPFQALFVIGSDVPVYKARNAQSEELGKLSWALVDLVKFDPGEFYHVRLDDGREGFLKQGMGRSPVDYRLVVSQNEQKEWKISAFVAGD